MARDYVSTPTVKQTHKALIQTEQGMQGRRENDRDQMQNEYKEGGVPNSPENEKTPTIL